MSIFTATIKFKDAYFSVDDSIEFVGDNPYLLLHDIWGDQRFRGSLSEKTAVTFQHVESGQKKRFFINFYAVDEDDFTCPKPVNEKAFDEWAEEVEPGILSPAPAP